MVPFYPEIIQILLIAITTILILWYSYRPSNLPPGPFSFPVIGCLDRIDRSNIPNTLIKWRKQYGDIFSFRLGSQLFVIVNGYEHIMDCIIKNGQIFSNRCENYIFGTLMRQKGIISSNNDLRLKIRQVVVTNLKKFGVGKPLQESIIIEEVRETLSFIEKHKGKAFEPLRVLSIAATNVISRIVLDRRFQYNDEDVVNIILDVNYIPSTFSFMDLCNFFPFLKHIPGDPTGIKKICNIYNKVFMLITSVLSDHRKTWQINKPRDIVECLLDEQHKDPQAFSDEVISRVLWDLFVAGLDGPSSKANLALLLIILHPEVQAKMHSEIISVIGKDRLPTLKDRYSMPYCQSVLAEIDRFDGFIRFISRSPTEDVVIGSYTIPKTSLVLMNVDSIHYDDKYFKDADKFVPTRFLTEEGVFKENDRNLLFGAGVRICPGRELGKSEVFLYVISILQTFQLKIDEEEQNSSMNYKMGISNYPGPYKVCASVYD